jgi:hypothetical protein
MSRYTIKFEFSSKNYKKSIAKAQEILMEYLELYDIDELNSKVEVEMHHEKVSGSEEFTVYVHARLKIS